MNYISHILMLLVLVISTIGIGYVVVNKYLLEFELKIILSFFTGEILYSFLWIIISSCLGRPYNVLTFLPLLIYFLLKGLKLLLKIHLPIVITRISINTFYGTVIGVILLFYSVLTFIRPYEWDHVVYRLPVMSEISKGNISFPLLSDNEYSIYFKPFVGFFGNLPYASESYSSILYSITSLAIAPQQLYLVNLILFLAFIVTILKVRFRLSIESRMLVCILILLSYGNSILIGTGLIDLNMMIYQFLALYSALMYRTNKSFIYLFTYFSTYSIAHKYTSLYVILPMILYILYYAYFSYKKNTMDSIVRLILKLSIIVIISGGFWYMKNVAMYWNPIYPLYLGHIGLDNSTYNILMDNLIYGLRGGRSFTDLINVLIVNYKSEFGVIIMTVISTIGILIKKTTLSKDNKFIILLCVFIYLVNFYLGSQISRFILIVPILIYILGVQVISRHKLYILLVVLILLIGIRADPLQWSVWSSRINIVKLIILGDKSTITNKYLGCLNNASNFLSDNNEFAYNLWDPYATAFYLTDSRFVNVPNLDNLSNFQNDKVSYLYLNIQYKNSFEGNRYVHRDMYIDERLNFENDKLEDSELKFKENNCELYKIK